MLLDMKQATKRQPQSKVPTKPKSPANDDAMLDAILDDFMPSEFDTAAREMNIARRGFPLDYEREAAQLAAFMASDETPPKVKTLIAHYMDELGSSTNVGIHTPAVLRVAYPIMRFRDGGSDGARVLLGIAINYITDEKERAALAQVWATERERLESEGDE